MIQPSLLHKGDLIGIAAPAGRIDFKEIEKAADFIRSEWQMDVLVAGQCRNKHHQFAGTDQERLEGMQQMINNPKVKAILCARGGYGSARIIDKLDFRPMLETPKWLIGYSDITVFHSHLSRLGIMSLHATMPRNFPDGTESLFSVLTEGKTNFKIPSNKLNRNGKARGVLTGGNLSMLGSISGSVSDIETDGKILFIEDLNEYLYAMDRLMVQLKRSGKLRNIAGLVAGGFSDMKDYATDFGKDSRAIILDALGDKNIPVCFDFPAGHIRDNRALIMGCACELEVGKTHTVLKQNSNG